MIDDSLSTSLRQNPWGRALTNHFSKPLTGARIPFGFGIYNCLFAILQERNGGQLNSNGKRPRLRPSSSVKGISGFVFPVGGGRSYDRFLVRYFL